MEWQEALSQKLDSYDYILVDANFFSGILDPNPANRFKTANELYEARRLPDLTSLEGKLDLACQEAEWKLNYVVRRDNVFTLPAIIEEVKNFERILYDSYRWHHRKLYSARKKKTFTRPYDRRRSHRRSRRFNEFTKRAEAELREENLAPHQEPLPLHYLHRLFENTHKTIQEFKIYSGLIKSLPRIITDASETDYQLVSAAYGYRLKNFEHRVAILSSDRHIFQIKYAHWELRDVFDIIDSWFLRESYLPEAAPPSPSPSISYSGISKSF